MLSVGDLLLVSRDELGDAHGGVELVWVRRGARLLKRLNLLESVLVVLGGVQLLLSIGLHASLGRLRRRFCRKNLLRGILLRLLLRGLVSLLLLLQCIFRANRFCGFRHGDRFATF